MVLFYGMLYPGLFVWIVWMAILCGAMPMNFFNSTALRGGCCSGCSNLGMVLAMVSTKKGGLSSSKGDLLI